LRDEGENTKLKLVKMRDLWIEGSRDAKCLIALAFWGKLKKEGQLPDSFT
jgi:ADP-sugar diphosphatase